MVIYVDTLVFVNTIIDYLLLSLTSFLIKRKMSIARVVVSSIIGGFFSLYIFAQIDNIFIDLLFKITSSLVLVLIAMWRCGLRPLIYSYILFLLLSFVLNGFVVALQNINNRTFFTNNLVSYFNISAIQLIVITMIVYTVIILIRKFNDKSLNGYTADLIILICGQSVSLKGFIDTGNNLRDPFGNLPVIIVNNNYFEKICNCINTKEVGKRKRLIPFNTVNEIGVLDAIRCDKTILSLQGGKIFEYKETIIANSVQTIGNGFDAIVPLYAVDRISDTRCGEK